MRSRPFTWLVISVVCFLGALYFWRLGDKWNADKNAASGKEQPTNNVSGSSTSGKPTISSTNSSRATNSRLAYRLSNTQKSVSELAQSDKALLLENALIDTDQNVELSIPEHLRAKGDPGTYIAQAHG